MKRYTSLMKWDNTYIGLQSLLPWSVYGDSNSFLMLNMREEKDCQKVAPFLQNLPTFKKRTHYFWYSKVTGAFPGGLWAVFGTIPSIPIPTPLANFGIELTLHSNSTLGIGVATTIPTQRNWGDSTGIPISKFPTLCSPLKRRKS